MPSPSKEARLSISSSTTNRLVGAPLFDKSKTAMKLVQIALLLLHAGGGVSTAFVITPPQCTRRTADMIWQGSSPRERVANPQRMSDRSNENDDEGTGADLAAQFFKSLSDRNISIEDDEMMNDDEEEEDERYEMEQRGEGEIVGDGASSSSSSEEDYDDEDDAILREYDVYPSEGVYSTLTNEQIYDEMKDRVLESAGAFVELTRGADDGGSVNDAQTKIYRPPTNVPDSGLTAGEVVELGECVRDFIVFPSFERCPS